ncbi:MAG: hypothetical protein RQ729_06080 [Wenzhouxiangellaceae bacterium]|nr:hypothetical protein [Wenzhouxiangellaceae bacterium]
MKNITVSMDEDTAQWARIEAARRGISVSRMLGELLRAQRLENSEYRAAQQRYQGRTAIPLKPARQNYPDRADVHDR